ncbi:MAG: hypothetical protein WDZ40_00815 [Candidatus Spechtbacterales bacterium]
MNINLFQIRRAILKSLNEADEQGLTRRQIENDVLDHFNVRWHDLFSAGADSHVVGRHAVLESIVEPMIEYLNWVELVSGDSRKIRITADGKKALSDKTA